MQTNSFNDLVLSLLVALALPAAHVKAQDFALSPNAAPLSHTLEARKAPEAWSEIQTASSRFARPSPELGGQFRPGTPETKYVESWFVATADKAREFYTRFPKDAHAEEAKEKEIEMLYRSLDETYATNQVPRMFVCSKVLFKDGRVDKAKRLEMFYFLLMTSLTRRSLLPSDVDVSAELQEDARILERDFRDSVDFRQVAVFAEESKAEKTRPVFRQLTGIPGMPGLAFKILTTAPLRQREAIGTSLPIQFTAIDDRNVDTAEMKGKILAVVFWGTSYPQCIPNVLRLEKLYQKFQAKGLEILGVNVDQNVESLKNFVSEHKIEWPQYWDGKEVGNKMVEKSSVTRAGTILIIDKGGLLRDIKGDEGLEGKIERLLGE